MSHQITQKFVRATVGFRLSWQRLFNRPLNVPREQTDLIELQTMFKMKVRVSVHTTRTRRSTNSWLSLFLLFEWIQSSIDQLHSHAETEQSKSTTLRTKIHQYILDWPWFSLLRGDRQSVTSIDALVGEEDCTRVLGYPPVYRHCNGRPWRQVEAPWCTTM